MSGVPELGGELMERRRVLESEGENMMNDWKLIDTIQITPSNQKKSVDLSTYGYKSFLIHGDIPKTANETYFRCGVGDINNVKSINSNKTYASEMIANIDIIDDRIVGFCGFDQGWAGSNICGALLQTPRVNDAKNLVFSFYPFVQGDEEAVIKVYGR